MSLLVTVERYQVITGDTSTAASAASAAIEDATSLLSEALGRPEALKSAERTEIVHVDAGGVCRPLAVPITVAAGYDFDTAALYGASPDSTPFRGLLASELPSTLSVTYTGGWVERWANLGAANALPASMEADIAWCAHARLRPGQGLAVPAGASSVSVGDASVSFGAGGAPARSESGYAWSKGTMKWKRRLP